MLVLGIETSCDETAASVVENGEKIISNVVASSLRFHKRYGGIIPEIASRKQLETITSVCALALKKAALDLKDINLIGVTYGPGLLGSLVVGVSFAKALSLGRGIPILGIDHLHSHIYSSLLNNKIKLPFISLVVSGGHTSLFYVRDHGNIKLIGSTQDDACGEAFDKVAKILGLGYPGGPYIERLAKKGDPKKIRFHCSNTRDPFDFSFSGIKTAVLSCLRNRGFQVKGKSKFYSNEGFISDVAASFQETVIDTLIKKSFLACRANRLNRLAIGGGVAANNRLRERFSQEAANQNINVYFPLREFCMDNAAMVAGLAYHLFKENKVSDLNLVVRPIV
ncbi:MAG: tRNA (adenosine(37)-N6)-threonylcarbamoyltransferase complex transferase subunit TsaD [Candidatus Omnitrophica bacterium]|nr:tRNA (adenosine(37)-N6)-threonylcarbamoyltransferase complex transferase subunit TsaD [Candidatus Omnitrophota bacterium]